ncbi:LPXTG cell wall anchor domain-containing protein, partial [Bacillus sp. HC-TM]
KIDDKLAELHTTKQNVDNKINEVSQSKQTQADNGTKNNNAKELPNAGSEQSNNMALGMLSVLGGILLVTRNKIKTLFSK